ncbi:MAG: hypothetical protein LBS76_03160 [Mycoplasmataceae bacterium]|jgi:hypothetical protein|nr:hypothetical protein [Mycoplasmataceae bacterium]
MPQITLKIENNEKTFKDFYELEEFVSLVKSVLPNKVSNVELLNFLDKKYSKMPKKTYKHLDDFFNDAGV